ncbi:succinyl-CoA--3-ketoacid-CoA transferase [Peribacillus butanolivorans]|uniref:Succinyl-CoA--3-ketoacid-CoA transferase n=1 Tax=Peribacillus butanolivorans TaxID=421767 RepID=A0AAX0RXF8_9BACI|nr:CoA transferase subunit A [Peribacillus butanolivorans]MCO0600782.1 CoA transferase subunit A [Peribacillus butanolivorans]PEJ23533.1 succinyl-CoA--3-ketoacid-CoA transferase [Peribacillus butanolivorans]
MKKVIEASEVRNLVKSGDKLLVGGFGLSGSPLTIIDELLETDISDLTVVSNNLGEDSLGLHKLFVQGKIKKIIGSFFTTNKPAVTAWQKGELEIDLIPQGTLAEAIRAGGAGIGGFYTKTAVGTELVAGKEEREIDGERYIFEKAIKGDVSLVRAAKADKLGNLIYHTTARNFNPMVATAGKVVIAEVDEIVEVGELDPEYIVTPHAYVDYIIESKYVKKGGKYVESR